MERPLQRLASVSRSSVGLVVLAGVIFGSACRGDDTPKPSPVDDGSTALSQAAQAPAQSAMSDETREMLAERRVNRDRAAADRRRFVADKNRRSSGKEKYFLVGEHLDVLAIETPECDEDWEDGIGTSELARELRALYFDQVGCRPPTAEDLLDGDLLYGDAL